MAHAAKKKTRTELARERAEVLSDALRDAGFDISEPGQREGDAPGLLVMVPVIEASNLGSDDLWVLAEIRVLLDGTIRVNERTDLEVLPNGRFRAIRLPLRDQTPRSGALVGTLLRQRGLGRWVRGWKLGRF